MSSDPRERHIDYVEFPAPSRAALATAQHFYRDVFGWSFQEWGEDYADTKDGGATVGFSAAPEHRPAATLVVLYTKELEATKERVLRAGGRIVKDIVSFPGGRRFEFEDPAGNRLGVWSDG